MTIEGETQDDQRVPVPAWVLVTTYVLCWSFAVALIATMLTGWIQYRVLLLALAVYLLLWPIFQVSPAEVIRRIFPS